MLTKDVTLVERDLGRDPLDEAELAALFRGRDPREFLNTRNETYRRMRMKENPPSPRETIRLMAREPNLIRRPIVVRSAQAVAGFDQDALERLLR